MSRLLGAVIAGGQSRRFGSDKAEALWQGQKLIDHVVAAVRPAVDELVICGRQRDGLTSLPDRPAADMGPLGGLNAALHHAREQGFAGVLTAGCDTPLLPAELFARLLASGNAAYVARLPVIGYWPVALAVELDAFLAQDRKHSIRAFADLVGAEGVGWGDLANVNEPADLAALRGAK